MSWCWKSYRASPLLLAMAVAFSCARDKREDDEVVHKSISDALFGLQCGDAEPLEQVGWQDAIDDVLRIQK